VLAWYHGERGHQRASGPELLMVAALMVIGGGVLAMLRDDEEVTGSTETVVRVPDDDRPSIAVLPFDNFSPDPGDAYFADGVHEEIISKLSKISAIRVISRSSVEQYREERRSAPQIGDELRVGFLLEGSARIAGGRVRLTAQLVDATADEHIWTEDYDSEFSLGSVLDVQSQIAQQVAAELRTVLTPEEQTRIAVRPTESIEAYNAYRVGRHIWNQRTPEALEGAITQFQRALDADSQFALGYVGLADAWTMLGWYEPSRSSEARIAADRAAQRALELDGQLGEAHTSLAAIKLWFDWDWSAAEAEFLTAVELNPNHANSHHWYGHLLAYTGRLAEGLERLHLALELDPLSPIISNNVADHLYWERRFSEAQSQYEKTLQAHPDYSASTSGLARSFLERGRYRQALDLAPRSGIAIKAYLALGMREEALSRLRYFEEHGPLRQVLRARMGFGDIDGAFAILEQALDGHLPWVLEEPLMDPYFEGMRSDPRWAEYLRRIRLDQRR
jgi:adenylate cyclase